MKLKLTVATRLLGASALAVAFVLASGANSFHQLSELTEKGAAATRATSAIKFQMQADMMHDALRGDVLAALVAGTHKEAGEEKAVKEDLGEHAKVFTGAIKSLREMTLPAEVGAAIAKLLPALDAYLASATATAHLAFVDNAAANTNMPKFMESFRAVEKEMGALSDIIEKNAQQMQAESEATSASSRHLLVAGALVAAFAIMLMGLQNSRTFRRQLGGEPEDVAATANAIAAGDMTHRLDAGRAAPGSIVAAMSAMQDSLVQVVGTVRESSRAVAEGSREIAEGSADLRHRTEAQAASLQETAASMEELGATVKNNTDTAGKAAQLATSASAVASQGGDAVGRVVSTMQAITQSSQKIRDIIGVVDAIAFQTNILALNAAVESARAGEQGRGFAVVASEVRSLAQRSAGAAKEIKDLIDASVSVVESGSRQVDDAGRTMMDIVAQIRSVNDLMTEITSASAEQSAGLDQVSNAVTQIDHTTQMNTSLAQRSAEAADNLSREAAHLVQAVEMFKL